MTRPDTDIHIGSILSTHFIIKVHRNMKPVSIVSIHISCLVATFNIIGLDKKADKKMSKEWRNKTCLTKHNSSLIHQGLSNDTHFSVHPVLVAALHVGYKKMEECNSGPTIYVSSIIMIRQHSGRPLFSTVEFTDISPTLHDIVPHLKGISDDRQSWPILSARVSAGSRKISGQSL